jgi:hypothetical protein
VVLVLSPFVGCSGRPTSVPQVDIDLPEVSSAIIKEFDKDGDTLLANSELDALSCVKDKLDIYDKDGDGKISAHELAARMETLYDPNRALLSQSCLVLRKSRPLAGAAVYFYPLSTSAKVSPVASGVSNGQGVVKLSVALDDLPSQAPRVSGLMRPGLYRVEVTHPSSNVPPKYNLESTRAEEVSGETVISPIRIVLDY